VLASVALRPATLRAERAAAGGVNALAAAVGTGHASTSVGASSRTVLGSDRVGPEIVSDRISAGHRVPAIRASCMAHWSQSCVWSMFGVLETIDNYGLYLVQNKGQPWPE
jgi:hypothetical protein